MRLRTGRKQAQNLYVQMGDDPSDEDEYIGVIFDPTRAKYLCEIVSEYWSERD